MPPSDQNNYLCRSALALPFLVNVGLVVDDVLDASILQDKYTQLIELWPQLGGSLLTIFDTRKFQCGSTADFKSRTLNEDLSSFLPFSRPVGSATPKILLDDPASTDSKFFFQVSSNLKSISKLRVTILKNATLLGFSFSHALSDGKSSYDIIRYFCDLLSSKPLPTFILPPDATGERISDLLRDKAPAPASAQPGTETFVSSHLTALKLHAKYMLLRVGEILGLSSKLTYKTVYIPGPWVDEIRKRAQKELESSDEHSAVHLTRNDIIAALYLKMVYNWKKTNDSPVDYIGPINYRGLLEPSKPGTHYMHNSVVFLLCQFSERELQTSSIAIVAARIRLATIQYTHPAMIRSEILHFEDRVLAPAMQDIRGGVRWGTLMATPWTTFNYTSLDFSGASREGRTPSVVFVNPSVPLTLGDLPSPLAINVKDGAGGYWFRAANSQRGWETFERCISMDSLFACT
ncbi:hypothetical protein BDV12DRAFT_196838 [Aspergillus spectabilis]